MTDSTPAEVPAPRPVWGMLVSIVDRPADTFAALLAHPRWKWILPLALGLLVAVASAWVVAPHSARIAEQATMQQFTQSGMSPEEAQDMMAQTARFRTPLFLGISSAITGAIGLVIVWVAAAAVLYFVSLVAGAEFNFGATFLVVAWSNLPIILRSLVQTVIIGVTGRFPVYSGLAALQTTGDTLKDSANPMIALLSFADVFWLWHIFLLVIGLAVATKFSRRKAFFIVLVYALLSIGLSVGLTMLGASFRQ